MIRILLAFLLLPFAVNAQAPANDQPCGAITVSVGSGGGQCSNLNFAMLNATYNAAYNTICGIEAGGAPDVWFKCVVPASGSLTIHTSTQPGSPDDDALVYAYRGPNCTTLTYVSCNDDGTLAPDNLMPVLKLVAQTPGDTIFLRINQFNSATNGLYDICISDPNPALVLDKKVGIGVTAPDATLDVNGTMLVRSEVTIRDDVEINGRIKITGGTPGSGKILTSDGAGLASWQTSSVNAGTLDQTLRNNGSVWVASSGLLNDGLNITIPGTLKLTGGTPATGKILTSDATGGATWQPVSNVNTGFSCSLITNPSIPTGISTKLPWIESFDDGNNYNTTTNEYTAPSSGLYRFDMQAQWTIATAFTGFKSFSFEIYKNNAQANRTFDYISTDNFPYLSHTGFTLKLAAGDKIDIRMLQNSGTAQNIGFGFSLFTGYRIY